MNVAPSSGPVPAPGPARSLSSGSGKGTFESVLNQTQASPSANTAQPDQAPSGHGRDSSRRDRQASSRDSEKDSSMLVALLPPVPQPVPLPAAVVDLSTPRNLAAATGQSVASDPIQAASPTYVAFSSSSLQATSGATPLQPSAAPAASSQLLPEPPPTDPAVTAQPAHRAAASQAAASQVDDPPETTTPAPVAASNLVPDADTDAAQLLPLPVSPQPLPIAADLSSAPADPTPADPTPAEVGSTAAPRPSPQPTSTAAKSGRTSARTPSILDGSSPPDARNSASPKVSTPSSTLPDKQSHVTGKDLATPVPTPQSALVPPATFAAHLSASSGTDTGTTTAPTISTSSAAPSEPTSTPAEIPATPSRVEVSKLFHSATATELNVRVRSDDFGAVTIRAALGREQLSAHISAENERLGAVLSSHFASSEDRQSQLSSLKASVAVSSGTTSGSGTRQQASQQNQPRSGFAGTPNRQQSAALNHILASSGAVVTSLPPVPSDRISIRI